MRYHASPNADSPFCFDGKELIDVNARLYFPPDSGCTTRTLRTKPTGNWVRYAARFKSVFKSFFFFSFLSSAETGTDLSQILIYETDTRSTWNHKIVSNFFLLFCKTYLRRVRVRGRGVSIDQVAPKDHVGGGGAGEGSSGGRGFSEAVSELVWVHHRHEGGDGAQLRQVEVDRGVV